MESQARTRTAEVPATIRTELAAPTTRESTLAQRLARVRAMQRGFRDEPIGGRLVRIKKLLYWFTASAFDRQGKVVETLLDLVEDLAGETARLGAGQPAPAPSEAWSPAASSPAGSPSTPTDEGSPRSLPAVVQTPAAQMLMPEKVLLYGLVFALKPRCCLEIGTFRGGSAAVICAAMDDNGWGQLVCVDPEPQLEPEIGRQIAHRATVIAGASPQVLPRARRAVPEPFTFALIDGDHSKQGVLRDIEGTLEQLADEAHLLFHDSHYFEVAEAIDEALVRHAGMLLDCGTLSTTCKPESAEGSGVEDRQVVWGGLRLLRFQRRRAL